MATAAGWGAGAGVARGQEPGGGAEGAKGAGAAPVPTRPLGRTGVSVSMLNLGTFRSPGAERLVRYAYAQGIRYVDTAESYGSEPTIARWLKSDSSLRKEIFLVTKDHPRTPDQFVASVDARLAALGTDYIDLLFIHQIGEYYGRDYKSLEWPKSAEWKRAFEKIKKTGKVKLVGFSCHDARRAEYLQAAAQGGFVDAIMLQYSPWLAADSPLNKALDACHKAGIGLISMKQMAGFGSKAMETISAHVPYLREKKLSAYQGLLHGIWSDERIASVCVSMVNTDQIRENVAAIQSFEPMKLSDLNDLRDAVLACGRTMCADCTGECARAGGTRAKLGDIARMLTYHDQYGYRSEARRQYRALEEADRDWRGADLSAAEAACPNRLRFSTLLPRAEECLG
jgi:predicted aldo/keto reductase-like oxidoreductase